MRVERIALVVWCIASCVAACGRIDEARARVTESVRRRGVDAGAANDASVKVASETPAGGEPSGDASLDASAALLDAAHALTDAASPSDLQRDGSAARGRSWLLNNGTLTTPYLSCGIPDKLWKLGTLGGLVDSWRNAPRIADRADGNAELPYFLSYATTRSGVRVVTTNCLLCHASLLGDSLVMGLGDPNRNFAERGSALGFPVSALRVAGVVLDPAERAELERFRSRVEAVSAYVTTDTVGMNPADTLFGALAAHRDRDTLVWRETPDPHAHLTAEMRLSTDVPAWWSLKHRDRMFWNGFGRGDHARIMMSASLLCLEDTAEAEAIDAYFPDVRAYVLSLNAPSYEHVSRRKIDRAAAVRGATSYAVLCRDCHGDTTAHEAPRPLVELAEVGTDPAYASILASGAGSASAPLVDYFFEFFNESWYGTHGAVGRLLRSSVPGYAAPPLEGLWATAPYFHNGSVPTLEGVLDPALRPKVYRRETDPSGYDYDRVGWPYEELLEKGDDTTIYDATRAGFGNTGHDFAASLDAQGKRDLLEHLKTL